jgi:pimeloyl-ACP methyl ester carboxylesterase
MTKLAVPIRAARACSPRSITRGAWIIFLLHALLIAFILTAAPDRAWGARHETRNSFLDSFVGGYALSSDHWLGIDRFITDSGEITLLFSDYSSGVVRRLFAVSDTEFVMGAGFNSASPVELTVRFHKDAKGEVSGISLLRTGGSRSVANRVTLRQEDVAFENGDARIAGTLITPATKGPHPAIVLLHGSGPLTRYSFGPYPHFFTSLGFAVLVYDKRGAGASTGKRLDASTAPSSKPASYYPDDLALDALAAMHFLRQRKDIDRAQIGFWGSSEGGMLATQVAARAKDVAFAINSSGFMGPLWETLRYQVPTLLTQNGAKDDVIQKQTALVDLWLQTARTGERWSDFAKLRGETVATHGSWFFQTRGDAASAEQARWDWEHVLSFNPLVALKEVQCPVLGLFGEVDPLTNASSASANMHRVLSAVGHKDVTTRIFANAGHSLSVMPTKDRMAPGVFETLRSWLRDRVTFPSAGSL